MKALRKALADYTANLANSLNQEEQRYVREGFESDEELSLDNLIRDTLWAELPECYDEISISKYRQRIYENVYTRYRVAA